MDNFPQLSQGLNISSIPAVFLLFRGNVILDFQGIPETDVLNEFFRNAEFLYDMQSDKELMTKVLGEVEGMI